LLVLVPHRDVRFPLRAWSASLFAAGLPGAWSFPWVAPLALLNRNLSSAELKNMARSMREYINLCGGRLTAGPPAIAEIKNENGGLASVFGPSLPLELPDIFWKPFSEAIKSPVSPVILGTAVVETYNSSLLIPNSPFPIPHPSFPISFRAGALANMKFRPLSDDGYSFEWEIGPLHWLPK